MTAREIDAVTKGQVRQIVYAFFAEECDVDEGELTDDTDIIEELEGDSLMLLALLEIMRGRFGLTVELKTLGRHLMKTPANTIGQVVDVSLAMVQHSDDILNVDL